MGPTQEAPPGRAQQLPGCQPPGLVEAPSYYHTPANPGRSSCKGNWDYQHLKRQPSDLIHPRLIILPFS